ncbi:ribonuclease III [Candidatus Curtissbacteria bacterium RBG_16_39_7]|uniref:Ribonuclease 3 n=1 Tax=Candidatus Curtissbacteria bacterium RBG_16_39_7 TaxID=1797707 RepID=A0A1F5G2Z3_9BACT|nr:MAG: ribonuclease III [Candidatus Curtissbacteria bacterium RBG_16_39_7]
MINIKPDLATLEKKIGIDFKNIDLLEEALTHRSFLNEQKNVNRSSNERMEFLGDSILSFVVTSFLFQKKRGAQEGELTSLRSLLVRAETLARAAQKISLGDFLLLSRGEGKNGRSNPTLLSDAYEALIGAIYLDQGFAKVQSFVQKTLICDLKAILSETELADMKGKLQMILQEEKRQTPTYKLIKQQGPDHAKKFLVGVYIGKKLLAEGEGESLKKASQDAAANALKKMELEKNQVKS